MFEIRCIVGDKKLADVLKALGSMTLEPPVIIPVGSNGTASPAKPLESRAAHAAKGGSSALLEEFIKKNKPKILTASDLRKFLVSNGYSHNGYSYALKKFIERGVLKKSKIPHTYEVISK